MTEFNIAQWSMLRTGSSLPKVVYVYKTCFSQKYEPASRAQLTDDVKWIYDNLMMQTIQSLEVNTIEI